MLPVEAQGELQRQAQPDGVAKAGLPDLPDRSVIYRCDSYDRGRSGGLCVGELYAGLATAHAFFRVTGGCNHRRGHPDEIFHARSRLIEAFAARRTQAIGAG